MTERNRHIPEWGVAVLFWLACGLYGGYLIAASPAWAEGPMPVIAGDPEPRSVWMFDVTADGSWRGTLDPIGNEEVSVSDPGSQAGAVDLIPIGIRTLPPSASDGLGIWRLALVSAVGGVPRTVIAAGSVQADRYGRWHADWHLSNGFSESAAEERLSEALVRAGLAVVWPNQGEGRGLRDALRQAETDARTHSRGIWGEKAQGRFPLAPEQVSASEDVGRIVVVRGRVVDAVRIGSVVYVNFGTDWRTDFTVTVPQRMLRVFPEANQDVSSWAGGDVEVRGRVERRNGPMIYLQAPEFLTFLR